MLETAVRLEPTNDVLVKETNHVMAKLGVDGRQRLRFLLEHMPDVPSDNLTWDLANAYSNVFLFDKALETLATHEFVAAECQETYLTEAYTFAQCAKGRLLRREGNTEEALECFRKAQVIPENFRAGWWDTQALYYARYFEAEALAALGRDEEAKAAAERLVPFIHSGYSPYMGPESNYYVALAYQMLNENVLSNQYMSKYVTEWECDLLTDTDRKPIVTALYWSYVPDGAREHRAAITAALAYSRLFYGDLAGAAKLFEESLESDPDNIKVKFELALLGKNNILQDDDACSAL